MELRLKALFAGETARLPFETAIDASEMAFQGAYPLKDVRADGEAVAHAGRGDTVAWVELRARVSYVYEAPCDRCAADMRLTQTFETSHVLVTELAGGGEADELVLVADGVLALDGLLLEDLILQMPGKHICKPDCKGLCPLCGTNLNEGLCGCETKSTDPRWDALKQLLDRE